MNVVMIVPTGIGAEIGGHAGDANPAAKLLASVSNNLITHPNVLNASDINEMTENMWYVEGSQLDQFLEFDYNGLKKPKGNRIIVVVNSITNDILNAVNAARATLGANIKLMELKTPLTMIATKGSNGIAEGIITGHNDLIDQLTPHNKMFDALAINTPIHVEENVALDYVHNGGVNPWGGVEARASRLIAKQLEKPVAHAPAGHTLGENFSEVVDPRMSAEMVSVCYLHCVLKGLHKAPRLVDSRWADLTVQDVDCLVTPADCYGTPHRLCDKWGIPIIEVTENKTCLNHPINNSIKVTSYIEAAGIISCMKIGVDPTTVTRPLLQCEHYV